MAVLKSTRCPVCRKPASPRNEHYPFCGKRCKVMDLGAWSAEEYRISRPLNETDEAEHATRPPEPFE